MSIMFGVIFNLSFAYNVARKIPPKPNKPRYDEHTQSLHTGDQKSI